MKVLLFLLFLVDGQLKYEQLGVFKTLTECENVGEVYVQRNQVSGYVCLTSR